MEAPAPRMGFVYRMCNDVSEIRRFYTDSIGLTEVTYRNDKDAGWVVYESNGVTFQFWRWDEELPVDQAWSWQPGNWEGESASVSWAIEVSEGRLTTIYKKMKADGVPMYHGKPKWFADNNYWGLKVKDPMGFTVDLYSTPEKAPDSAEWPE